MPDCGVLRLRDWADNGERSAGAVIMMLEEPDMGRPPKIIAPPPEPEIVEETQHAKIIGHNFRRRRLAMDLTQVEMAQKFGLQQQQIALVENGQINLKLETMEKLARVVGMELSDLLRVLPDLVDGPQRRRRKNKET